MKTNKGRRSRVFQLSEALVFTVEKNRLSYFGKGKFNLEYGEAVFP